VFPLYQREVLERRNAALLFCVIGGKLSEGINFSDDLGRTVVVCGLPYANSKAIEIQEKMAYFDKLGDPTFRGCDYYENLCMKTLNQAIGRSIRHIGDYATIILVDQRFKSERIQKKLPRWIQESLVEIKQGGGDESKQINRYMM
jgi:chromosome transmission fidelity protein 1